MAREDNFRVSDTILEATARIVAAYISRADTSLDDIPHVVAAVQKALGKVQTTPSVVVSGQNPAVPIEDSVHDDYLVCLEDGKRLSMLKRHLSTTYGMTIDQYKERWGLPQDYPSVSANYARRRSDIARTIGLGKSGRKNKQPLKAVG